MPTHEYNPIKYYLKKRGYSRQNMADMLGCSLITAESYIKDPGLIRFRDIVILCGMFGLQVEQLSHVLARQKPSVNKQVKWNVEQIIKGIDKELL